jgi:hypothetical protein
MRLHGVGIKSNARGHVARPGKVCVVVRKHPQRAALFMPAIMSTNNDQHLETTLGGHFRASSMLQEDAWKLALER